MTGLAFYFLLRVTLMPYLLFPLHALPQEITERCAPPEHGSKPGKRPGLQEARDSAKKEAPDDTCELGLESDQFIPELEEREIQKGRLQEKNKEMEPSPSLI